MPKIHVKYDNAYPGYPYTYPRKSVRRSKLDIVKKSIKRVSKQYCEESSICGLKHLVDDRVPLLERIIWAMVLIIGLSCSVSLVWMTFQQYYRAPLVTTQMPEGVSVSKIIFPAVGICSNNRISKRAVTELAERLLTAERNKKYTPDQMLDLLFGLGQLYDLQPMTMDDGIVPPMKLHKVLGDYDVQQLMRNLQKQCQEKNSLPYTVESTSEATLTPRCDDLLLRCAWNAVPKSCLELFDFRLTVNGYCCTFNYLRSSDIAFIDKDAAANKDMYNYGNKSSFDFDQGLKFLLRLNESDDFFYNIPLQGAQLQFSDAYDFPDALSGSFAMQIISPGVQMTVLVSASFTEASRDIQHVPIALRKCRFYDESDYLPFYTYSDCMLKCRMYFLLDKCNCTPFTMPKMENARTCDMRDVACLRLYYVQSSAVRPNVDVVPPELELDLLGGGIDCPMCCPTCSKTTYSYDFSNVAIYPEYMNTLPDEDRDDWLKGVNFTEASIVHVKYASEVADCYGQNVIMKWFDLISNIGSTCGFVTGFSFVSVLEFIYFFTVKFFREVSAMRQRQMTSASTIEADTIVGTVSRFRPIYWDEITRSTNFGHRFSRYMPPIDENSD